MFWSILGISKIVHQLKELKKMKYIMYTGDTEFLNQCLSLSSHLFKPFENYYFLNFVT